MRCEYRPGEPRDVPAAARAWFVVAATQGSPCGFPCARVRTAEASSGRHGTHRPRRLGGGAGEGACRRVWTTVFLAQQVEMATGHRTDDSRRFTGDAAASTSDRMWQMPPPMTQVSGKRRQGGTRICLLRNLKSSGGMSVSAHRPDAYSEATMAPELQPATRAGWRPASASARTAPECE